MEETPAHRTESMDNTDDDGILWISMTQLVSMFVRIGLSGALLLFITPILIQSLLALLVLAVLMFMFVCTMGVVLPMRLIYEPIQSLILTLVSSFDFASGGIPLTGIVSIVWITTIFIAYRNSF